MASVWNKIDTGLALIYTDFLKVREQDTSVVRLVRWQLKEQSSTSACVIKAILRR